MTGLTVLRRLAGPSLPLLMAALAALTVASLARTQGYREAQKTLDEPAPLIRHAVLESAPARHGICLYSTGAEDDPPDDQERIFQPRERARDGAQ